MSTGRIVWNVRDSVHDDCYGARITVSESSEISPNPALSIDVNGEDQVIGPNAAMELGLKLVAWSILKQSDKKFELVIREVKEDEAVPF